MQTVLQDLPGFDGPVAVGIRKNDRSAGLTGRQPLKITFDMSSPSMSEDHHRNLIGHGTLGAGVRGDRLNHIDCKRIPSGALVVNSKPSCGCRTAFDSSRVDGVFPKANEG